MWTEKEKQLVKIFLQEFQTYKENEVKNYDIYLWISRKVLSGSKDKREVKKYLAKMYYQS